MNNKRPVEILRRKLSELQAAEAIESDASAKFKLKEQIEQTKAEIRTIERVESPEPARSAPQVVPKGLRSFDEHDADFFLQLLPGPYRADGLPESFVTNRLLDASLVSKSVSELLPHVVSFGRWAIPSLKAELETRKTADTPERRHQIYRRQLNAFVALASMGRTDSLWQMLRFDPLESTDPTRRSYVITRYAASGGHPAPLLAQLDIEDDPSIRQALLLILGDFTKDAFPGNDFADRVITIFRGDDDPGVHSAAEWVVNRWKREGWLGEVHDQAWQTAMRELATGKAKNGGNWYLTKPITGPKDVPPAPPLTMVILDAKPSKMGSPVTEAGRSDDETQHTRTIDRKFAIASTELTNAQFRRAMLGEEFRKSLDFAPYDLRRFPEENNPAVVSWYMAAAYCNWLSEQAGLETCYEPDTDGKFGQGMRIKPNFLTLSGYRLPTEAEWEYACRAGSETAFSFGDAEELLAEFGWYKRNSPGKRHPVASLRPNGFGLFDMHGNLWEWCSTRYIDYPDEAGNDAENGGPIESDESRVLRGGSFLHDASGVRGASRDLFHPDNHSYGFRVARTCR